MNRNEFVKHPIYSSVIAAIIFAILSTIYVWIQSMIVKVSFASAWEIFLNTKVSLFQVLIIAFSIYVVIQFILKSKKKRWKRKLQRAAGWLDEPNHVKYLWDVNLERGNLYIDNIRIYCTNHQIDMKYDVSRCPDNTCINGSRHVNIRAAKVKAKSIFEHQLNQLKLR